VLGESAAIVALLFEAWFADEAQVDIFDAVLVAKGFEDLVATSRPVLPASDGDDGAELLNPRTRLGKPVRSAVYGPFSIRQIFEFIVLLPLNFVPWIGVPLFLFLTGYRAGPLQHWRYFKLKGMNRKQRSAFVKQHRWMYTWFGTVALMLQLIPVLSMLFLLTTAGGSALWAASLEESIRAGTGEREGEAGDGLQDGYADDPV
jgi:hypothetical protein